MRLAMNKKYNTEYAKFSSHMNRYVKGTPYSYPSYQEVIAHIGNKPEKNQYCSFILSHNWTHERDLVPSDFFWNRRLSTKALNKCASFYPAVQRQQIKKALQKLKGQQALVDAVEGKTQLKFKRSYSKTNQYYRDYIGSTIGSYKIIDLWRHDVSDEYNKRTIYMFICRCNRCHNLTTKRANRLTKNEGIMCPRCTYGIVRDHRNSAIQNEDNNRLLWNADTELIIRNSVSQYSIEASKMFEDF